MCCEQHPDDGSLPPVVAQMLSTYRDLHREHPGFDWGDEMEEVLGPDTIPRAWWEYGRHVDFGELLLTHLGMLGHDTGATFEQALHRLLTARSLPPGIALVTIDDDGIAVDSGRSGKVIPGTSRRVTLVTVNATSAPVPAHIAAHDVLLAPGQVWVLPVDVSVDDPSVAIAAGAHAILATLLHTAQAVALTLRSSTAARWTVVDDTGGGWFPSGALPKFDQHGRPYFHGAEVTLDVPAGPITVTAARGIEFEPCTATIDVSAAHATTLEMEPVRLYDAAARGWYGGDLHVHLNYSGDFVATPHDAAAMQAGEALHFMNLVAGNWRTSRIYDEEAFRHWAGRDLPWSTPDHLASWGVEYRNDLLGHFHAVGATTPPSQYQSGHVRSDHPHDWPPNATACQELRSLGATVGYTHPVMSDISEDLSAAFAFARSNEARELPADAALGLVDSMDLIGGMSSEGSVLLYHHLLSCGLRLAATAGTDVFLSFTQLGVFSNPPGFARVFADLRGNELSVPAWQEAVRRGRTFVSNGPWLELDVDGCGPGDVLDVAPGTVLKVSARCLGPHVDCLQLVGPDGVITEVPVTGPDGALEAELLIDEATWVAAVARGPAHPEVLGPDVFAHTTPVHVEVAGSRVRRAASASWCLDWLQRFEDLVRAHGHFESPAQLDDLVSVVDRAREFYAALL